MRRVLPLLLGGWVCLCCLPSARGQAPGPGTHELTGPVRVLWEAREDSNPWGAGFSESIAVSPDGARLFVTAKWDTFAYDAFTGEELWKAPLFSSWAPVAGSVATSPDGSTVFVTAVRSTFPVAAVFTIAYEAETGEPIWWEVIEVGNEWFLPTGYASVAVSPDGTAVFVAGRVDGDGSWTICYEAAGGQRRWTDRGSGAAAIVTGPDGSAVFVTGDETVARDPATGSAIWIVDGGGLSIVVSRDGGAVFVTGEHGTVALEAATGNELWYRNERGLAVATSADRGLVFVAEATGTVAHDSTTGETVWTADFEWGRGHEWAASLAVSPDDGMVLVTGVAMGIQTGEDYATVAYEAATGEQIWTARYDGPASGYDRARAIAVSPDSGTVFVTGRSDGTGPLDEAIATVVYRSKGPRQDPPRRVLE